MNKIAFLKIKLSLFFLILFFSLTSVFYSQTKQEKIDILKFKIDSLTNLVNNQKKLQESSLVELSEKKESNQKKLDTVNELIQNSKNLSKELTKRTDLLNRLLNKTRKIGSKTWMNTNLNSVVFQNGDTIIQAKSSADWKAAFDAGIPAWCYYENNAKNDKKYGKLYNWYAVVDSRNVCPVGWRIPNLNDLENLLFNGKTSEEVQMIKDAGDNCPTCVLGGIDFNYSGSRSSDGSFLGLENILKSDGSSYKRGTTSIWFKLNSSPGYMSYSDDGNTSNTWWGSVELDADGHSIRCVKD